MGSRLFLVLVLGCLFFQFLPEYCMASIQNKGRLKLGFKGSQMTWIDQDGMILVSDNSDFAFGFHPTQDVTLFLLVVMHLSSQTVVWSANRASPVRNSDYFFFDDTGNAYLGSGGSVIWETGTAGKGVSSMELRDSGNLVLVSNDSRSIVWQSFSHPVDTLLSNQVFLEGMKLVSSQNPNNLSYSLEIKSGDVFLSAGFRSPQRYWAMSNENRKTINKVGDQDVVSAVLDANSWKMYDKSKDLILEFIFSDNTDPNVTWAAVLGDDGVLTFSFLESGSSPVTSPTRIPQDECGSPAACDPYFVCYKGKRCQCPLSLPSCKPMADSLCDESKSVELVEAGDSLSYFALGFTSPSLTTDLNGCKASCLKNCSCVAIFFDNSSEHCFLFDQIGSLQGSVKGPWFRAFVKVSTGRGTSENGGNGKKHVPVVIAIVILTVIVILSLVYGGLRYHRRRITKMPPSPKECSEEDDFLEGLSGMPIRFTYKDLQNATDDFKVKLGQGGFGSVYKGVLRDGTPVAVKKLEGIGQGKKEFRAEVSIIGSIHHLHLVRLRGFCAEGAHRLLAYEYMANGSLDRWLFRDTNEFMLDWDTRFSIALGTAKGLAYLHQDCDAKIVHCDIKPENMLLDEHFHAKVSDFGLAKLMTREQSHVFTTLRGTRGYLAPEWITNYAISEKSDVYSYGMVLLEIIGGRKNYDPSQSSEKSHFPTYAFKMMEEGKLNDVIDMKLKIDGNDERIATAINVALWCIQDDMSLRPSMTKVVQMLERICPVMAPPTSSILGNRLFSNAFKSFSDEGTSSEYNSDLSAVRLSGPR